MKKTLFFLPLILSFFFCSASALPVPEGKVPVINIPDIMGGKKNWPMSERLMKRWFNGDGSNLILGFDTILNLESKLESPKAAIAIEDWEKRINNGDLINDSLVVYLKEELIKTRVATGQGYLIPDGGFFDHITEESKVESDKWFSLEEEKKLRGMHWLSEKIVGTTDEESDFLGAFGEVTLRFSVAGSVSIEENSDGSGNAKVIIKKVGLYFKDSYDFVGFQILGCWSQVNSPYLFKYSGIVPAHCTLITNGDFREFNIQKGYDEERGNFRIFSEPKIYDVNEIVNISLTESEMQRRKIYDDVDHGTSFYTHIKNLNNKKIINGENNLFSPSREITRLEFIKMIVKSIELSSGEIIEEMKNPDCTPSIKGKTEWPYKYIRKSFSVKNSNDSDVSVYAIWDKGNCHNYNEYITRGEAAYIIATAKSLKLPNKVGNLNYFGLSDDFGSHVYKKYIQASIDEKYLSGYSRIRVQGDCIVYTGTCYRPDNNISRGEASKIVNNAFFPAPLQVDVY